MTYYTIEELVNDVAEKIFNDYGCEGKTLIQWIETIKNHIDNKWIPCNKFLPEPGGKYLTTCEGIEIPQIRFYEGCGNWNSQMPVKAWMPLPEIYSGD